MEGFKNENNQEKKDVSIELDNERLKYKFWGRSQEAAAIEYLKIFSIIKHIKEKGYSSQNDIGEEAKDLFTEFNVAELEYSDIFTDQVLDQILSSPKINSISVDFNGVSAHIDSSSTADSVVKEWQEKWRKMHLTDSPEKIKEQKFKEEKRNQAQIFLDKKFIELKTIDFTNQEKLVNWLFEYFGHYHSDVIMREEEILEKFKAQGYTTKDNDEINRMLGETLKDKERLGKVIIGYLLTNGALALQRNTWFLNEVEKWRKM